MLQEEESREEEGKMPDRTEYYLESLLSDAFKGKGFQKLSELVQEKDIYPPQKYNKQLLNQLDKVLKKELDKNEFSNVSLLLKCIQLYCRSDPQEGRRQLLESFIPYLGHLATESNVTCAIQQEALRTLNTMLDNAGREERKKFAVSEEMCLLTKELAKTILDVGDYDIQVAIMEALFRLTLKKWRDDLIHNWFEDQHLAKAFREIKDREFETDSRKFLNELNERLGDERRVCSIPCKAAHADMIELNKPADDKLEEFWIDFNYGSESITFYLESPEGGLWESVRLLKEDVNSYYLQEEEGENVLKMLMKNPTSINKKEVTKIKIHFDSQFDISTPLFKAVGKDKMMAVLDRDANNYREDQPPQNAVVASSHPERKEDFAGTDSLSDILTSQLSNESVTTTTKGITAAEATTVKESQQAEKEECSQASRDAAAVAYSASALKGPPSLNTSALKASPLKEKDTAAEPRVKVESYIQATEALPLEDDAVEKKNKARSLSKQITEAKKDAYEFECLTDTAAHEMVSEMKQKVFVEKAVLHRSSEQGNVQLSKSERRLSASSKNHLFLESSHETPSNGISEKSWILDSQKRSTPKMADYTRKRPRVRSNLKVLPLSSPSSSSDHHAKKVRSTAMSREKARRRMKPSTEMRNITTMETAVWSSNPLPHNRQNGLEMVDATMPLSSNSSPIISDAGSSKKYESASSTMPLEDEVSKAKRKLSDFSAVIRKHLKYTERTSNNEWSSSIPFEPKKLFNSIEMEEEAPKDGLEDNVFASQVFEEEIGNLGVLAAFENFTRELKKTFWSRYKRMETYTQSTLKAPGQNISALLNQIHQSRLNELEAFHKIVVQELANLEKRSQFLSSLEKDTVAFWTKQSNKLNYKLNAFCIHQMQRIQSMDSVLDETSRNEDNMVPDAKIGNAVDHKEEKSKDFVVAPD